MMEDKIRVTPYYIEWQPMRKNDTEELMMRASMII